ncbi:hypothetical protein JX266_000748 [Neoarthrinium moseri]|nr:hypothetical protein JX266_000748 [Neoarthrinium moseri]
MAEALAAIGLASNILQFVEVGITAVRSAHKLYKGADDLSKADKELELLTRNVKLTLHRIQHNAHVKLPDDLRALITICGPLADELLSLLDNLKIDPEKDKRVESMKKTFKAYRTRHEIKDLSERIEKIRIRICDHMNVEFMTNLVCKEVNVLVFEDEQAKLQRTAWSITDLATERPWEAVDDSNTDSQLMSNVPARAPTSSRGHSNLNGKQLTGRESRKLAVHGPTFGEGVRQAFQDDRPQGFHDLVRLTAEFSSQLRFHRPANRVLRSLHFNEIKERQADVTSAYKNTFEWIFDDDSTVTFHEWLRSSKDDGVYWIAGDPGSGKSTLMKFLLNHQGTTRILDEWAGKTHLATGNVIQVGHFFWSAGTSVQKSQEGLFRTLLFQIFLKRPKLIPKLCPQSWADDELAGTFQTWTRSELFATMKRLTEILSPDCRICMFIDGLDEYYGNHKELIDVLREIGSSPYLKICVSSRPWIEFRNAFERGRWKLQVQDLTQRDIRNFVTGQFDSVEIVELPEDDDSWTTEALIEEICRRAQGVFLWVFLVTRSLIRGAGNGDNMRDLQKRLNELPTDLEKYFEVMFDSIEDLYRQRTARIFSSLVHVDTTLPILIFHFFDVEEHCPDYAYRKDKIKPMTESQVLRIVKPKRHQLIAQCRDLLKLSVDQHEPAMLRDRAGFLHRTVWDFLRTENMTQLLSHRSGPGFEPRLSLSNAFLAMCKIIPHEWVSSGLIQMSRIMRFVLGAVSYSQQLEAMNDCADEPMLDELQSTVKVLVSSTSWQRFTPTEMHILSIEDLAVRCGLYHYIGLKVPKATAKDRARLLHQALRPSLNVHGEGGLITSAGTGIDLKMLRLLLDLGVSPNVPSAGARSVWELFITEVSSAATGSGSPQGASTFEACRLMLSHGADRIVTINNSEIDVTQFLRDRFPDQEQYIPGPCNDSHSDDQGVASGLVSALGSLMKGMWGY